MLNDAQDHARQRSGVLMRIIAFMLALYCAGSVSAQPWAESLSAEEVAAQRALYLELREKLSADPQFDITPHRETLAGYPLLPYIEYSALQPRLDTLPRADVDRFLEHHGGTYLGQRLRRAWVAQLARQEQWEDVVEYHDPANTYTTLSCHALHARLQTGDETALDEVRPLWDVGRSQPNECDPVFDAWMDAGHLTPEVAWSRFGRSLRAGQRGLARYVAGLMPERERDLAGIYLQVDSQPERVARDEALDQRLPEMREIILHGVQRLAVIDAPQAMLHLHRHHARHEFSSADMLEMQRFIALRLIIQGFARETESLLKNTPELATENLVSTLIRDAMREKDWDRIADWLDWLPEQARTSERWTYWRARLLEQQGGAERLAEADSLYRDLAGARNFYGFLAADLLDREYEMLHRPVAVNGEQLQALYRDPGIRRAHELYQLGDEVNALNEWEHTTRDFSEAEILSIGRLAESWGWYRNSIQAMIRIGYWDDLDLRFPLAYAEYFANAADQLGLSRHLLFAVARQESAFMHNARSPAGARGLMQLMPGTARQTAESAGMAISTGDLYEPEVNIALGSLYMSELLEEFNGNRVLAAAAYNAGPNRVRQWLRRSSENPLPLDMWIETIPFFETRGYVQNVLAYSVIYAYRMGEQIRFLDDSETGASF